MVRRLALVWLRAAAARGYASSSSSSGAKLGPLLVYERKVQDGSLMADEHQSAVVRGLQRVYDDLQTYEAPKPPSELLQGGFFGGLFQRKREKVKAPKGLYIHGSVGGGKTMLMDLFFNTVKGEPEDHTNNVDEAEGSEKKRVHFNAFMLDVHSRIHNWKKNVTMEQRKNKPNAFDPIPPVAESILRECYLLCFDEFQVTDIGDAMILKRLFTELFDIGCVVIATSNRAPDDLYLHGLQRSNFVPFIQVLKDHCEIVSLNSGIDYRRVTSESNTQGGTYFVVDRDSEESSPVDKLFKYLISKENDVVRPRTINIMGRNVKFNKTCGQVLDTTFSELCERPLGSSDYLMLARSFHTIIIREVPQITAKVASGRRFITLIDNLYDNKTRLIISADVPISDLFSTKTINTENEDRMLMDDLGIAPNSENAKASIFTGEEEIFAFDRCLSRIIEMQTQEYWDKWEIQD